MTQVEQAKPAVPITLGGKERMIVFDWWSISLIIEERGEEFLASLAERVTLPKILFLLWAGLASSDPELDPLSSEGRRAAQRRVAGWISEEHIPIRQVTEKVMLALANSAPQAEKGETKNGESASGPE